MNDSLITEQARLIERKNIYTVALADYRDYQAGVVQLKNGGEDFPLSWVPSLGRIKQARETVTKMHAEVTSRGAKSRNEVGLELFKARTGFKEAPPFNNENRRLSAEFRDGLIVMEAGDYCLQRMYGGTAAYTNSTFLGECSFTFDDLTFNPSTILLHDERAQEELPEELEHYYLTLYLSATQPDVVKNYENVYKSATESVNQFARGETNNGDDLHETLSKVADTRMQQYYANEIAVRLLINEESRLDDVTDYPDTDPQLLLLPKNTSLEKKDEYMSQARIEIVNLKQRINAIVSSIKELLRQHNSKIDGETLRGIVAMTVLKNENPEESLLSLKEAFSIEAQRE